MGIRVEKGIRVEIEKRIDEILMFKRCYDQSKNVVLLSLSKYMTDNSLSGYLKGCGKQIVYYN